MRTREELSKPSFRADRTANLHLYYVCYDIHLMINKICLSKMCILLKTIYACLKKTVS